MRKFKGLVRAWARLYNYNFGVIAIAITMAWAVAFAATIKNDVGVFGFAGLLLLQLVVIYPAIVLLAVWMFEQLVRFELWLEKLKAEDTDE